MKYGFVPVPFLFYFSTACRTVGFSDTALLISDMVQFRVTSHVNNHPLTVLTGSLLVRLLPLADVAHRANMVSVLYSSMAVVVFYLLLLSESGSVLTAAAASLLLMVGHSLWWHGTIVENYAASAFLTTVCLYCWRKLVRSNDRRWLLALCFFAGLGLSNHVQMAFVCIGAAVTGVLSARRDSSWWPTLPLCGAAATAGMTPWLALLLRDLATSGSLSGTVRAAFVGKFSGTFFSGSLWPSLYDTGFVFWFQSPSLYLLGFGLAGLAVCFREKAERHVFWGIVTPLAINTATFATYPTWDKFAFLLESFLILYYFAGCALDRLLKATMRNRGQRAGVAVYLLLSLATGPYLYTNIPTWALNPRSPWHARYNNSYSANTYFHSEFIVNPNKSTYDEVEKFAALLFEKLPRDAVFLDSDSRTYYTLTRYFQGVKHLRNDVSVLLVNSWGIANWGLESGTLVDMMIRAYHLDKPFYAISNQRPIAALVKKAREKEEEIAFVKFPLSESRWVYRLATQGEKRKAAVMGREWFKPVRIAAPRGYHDLDAEDIGYVNTGEAARQEMSSYDGQWHSGDQVFFHGEKPGTGMEFYLETQEARTVDLTVWLTTAPDYGRVKIELLPSGAHAEVDLFDFQVTSTQVTLPGVQLRAGVTGVKITVEGKSNLSSGFNFGIDGIGYSTIRTGKERLPAFRSGPGG